MEQFLDLIFSIRWWQWLLGMSGLAGAYYLVGAFLAPFLKGVQETHAEEIEKQQQEEQQREREHAHAEREAARREHLKRLPSGPVEPAKLPKAILRIRNHIVPVPQDAELTLGSQVGASVRLVSRGVSREHAKIRPGPGGYVLYDLVSQAGTFVNGERVESRVLADGDRIRIGTVEALFKLGAPPKAE